MAFVCTRCKNQKTDFDFVNGRRILTCNQCRENKKKYASTERGKEVQKMSDIKRYNIPKRIRYRKEEGLNMWKKYPEKILARQRIYYRLKTGKITKLPCVICGDTKVQAHHLDYVSESNIIWLCRKCHTKIHKGGGSYTVDSKEKGK